MFDSKKEEKTYSFNQSRILVLIGGWTGIGFLLGFLVFAK